MAERGRFEPPRPFKIRWAELVPILAHYSARKKSIRAEENYIRLGFGSASAHPQLADCDTISDAQVNA
jgi:hypothetical protein